MIFDVHNLVLFLHLLLFAYWLGSDLGVMINSIYANRSDLTGNARGMLRDAGTLIDMAPRTCLVLMVPVGITLATRWGLDLSAGALLGVWVFGFAWLWMVWMVHWRHGSPAGMFWWKIDLAVRCVVMVGFITAGISGLTLGEPVASFWLAAKMLLFGVLILLGVAVRFMLLFWPPVPKPATEGGEFQPQPFWTGLRLVVFAIWGLVMLMALIGISKPL